MNQMWKYVMAGLILPTSLLTGVVICRAEAPRAGAPASTVNKSGERGNRSGYGFVSTLEKAVGLSPQQQDSVRGLLAQQRQDIAAVREQTDNKIRGLLTPEQQKKFDVFLANQKAKRNQKIARR
jgi:hypothetical protein